MDAIGEARAQLQAEVDGAVFRDSLARQVMAAADAYALAVLQEATSFVLKWSELGGVYEIRARIEALVKEGNG